MEISKLDKISYSILLQETLELGQVLQSIVNSQDTINNSDVFIAFLPIMSSVCLGWCDLFTKKDIKIEIPDIEGYSSVRLLKNCRIGLKLYCDQRIGKATKQLKKNSEEIYRLLKTDYNIFQRLVVSMLGQCDFSVFTINELPYGNTSQLFLYISDIINFERYKSLGVWETEARKVVFKFYKLLSQFIKTIIDSFAKSNMIDKDSQIELEQFNFSYDDYFLIDEKRRNILRGDLPFEVQLQLFNIVCQNNFITNVLPKILQSSSFLYNRTKIQTYLVSVITINNIINKYPNIKYQKLLKQIIETKEVYFGKGSMFRNNIFHYMIQGIEESVFLNPDRYFNEFVEFYSKTDFNQFMQKISEEIDKINKIIYQLINFYEIKLFIILWRNELHMSKKFYIFSDESNHDKSITNKGDNINIDNKGLSREYVRSFLKIDTSCLNCVRDEVESLENRYFSCQGSEPKGKDLFKLSEKVGLKNLSEGATNYFFKLLDIIDKYDIKIFLVIFNKFEYVIIKSVEIDLNRLSKKIKCTLEEDKEIKYSLAKFFENHYSDRLCNALFKEKNSQTNYRIKKAIYDMNKGLKNHKLKDYEYIVGKNLYSLIDDGIVSFNTKGSYKWDYTFESKVFLDLMNQDDNRKITISFDKGTRVSAVFKEQLISRNIENIEVTEDIESKEDIFIRFSDYFATFFGKLSRSYSNSFKLKDFETGKKNYSTVESIPQSWFELDETQFYLAKRIGELINKGSVILLHGILADTPIGLKNYFQFISDFKEFSDYQAVDNVKLSQLNNQRLSETWNTSYSKQGIFFSPYDATYGALSEDFGKS